MVYVKNVKVFVHNVIMKITKKNLYVHIVKMAMDMGINYVPVYTTEWLHGRSRRGALLKRMEPETFNDERFFAQTG